ncbi:MAG: UvrD-helicase domain-containing protein [Leptospirillum sp.]
MSLLSRRMEPEDWKPIGVNALEVNALDIIRSTGHRSVNAGPGSGKTELLAQRAAFLLQTGASQTPQRILAISFKKDAATNLLTRVRKRCHRNHASRLDSLTFDAFAKGLLDRFGQALPERWRPKPDYEIMFPNDRIYRTFLNDLPAPPSDVGLRANIMDLTVKAFERTHLFGRCLPLNEWDEPTPAQWAVDQFWHFNLHERGKAYLSFPMIGRLAELLVRTNPMLRTALKLTYSHLFMDEFQDTTQVQYDLVRTIFFDSETTITAVGDQRQQIMRWAMAMEDPFRVFEEDFGATHTLLLNNYRSSPDLVRIQHVLGQVLDAHAVEPISMTTGTIIGESCAIWDFSSPQKEAEHLAKFIKIKMKEHKLTPRDFVLLVRQKATDYAETLAPIFGCFGLSLRNEAAIIGSVMLQDLVTEEISKIFVSLLHLAMNDRAGQYWSECQESLAILHGILPDDATAHERLAQTLDQFARTLRDEYPNPINDKVEAATIVKIVLDFVGKDRLISSHPAYQQGDWFEKVIEAVTLHLEISCWKARDWKRALNTYEGLYSVPLMTIHKSKGLEYHTVIFIGLDDGAWWSFDNDQVEATAGFFVAFTRAKQQVAFTYCPSRGARNKISTLYSLLQRAGVRTTAADACEGMIINKIHED